jgi:hypothetical protein
VVGGIPVRTRGPAHHPALVDHGPRIGMMRAMSDERPVLVRPRGGRLDHRLEGMLIEAGVDFGEMQTIAPGMPDTLALHETIKRTVSVLVVPFHPHADMQGEEVNGLEFCRKLIEEQPGLLNVPVIMPVRAGSQGTLRLKATLGDTASAYEEILDKQILIVFEDDLAGSGFLTKLRDHLKKHRDARSQTSGVFSIPRPPS